MKTYINLFLLTFLLASCSSQKTTSEKSTSKNSFSEKAIQEYKQQGYTLGTIKPNDTGECRWVIQFEGSNELYDPVNIDDEKFASLKTQKTSIFFKFLRLRRQNRCEGISPIQLTETIKTE